MSHKLTLATVERLVVLGLGTIIVLTLVGLVVGGARIDPSLAAPLRLLLALGAAVVGAFLPGAAFKIDYRDRGLALRAAGAAAFFTLVWLGGPRIPTDPAPNAEPTIVSELHNENPGS